MASFIDRLALIITADSSQGVRELKKVGSTAEESFGAAGKATGSFIDKIVNLPAPVLAVGAALVTAGGFAVRFAEEGQAATARLGQAIDNAGQSTDAWAPKIQSTADAMAKLGFNQADTENSIARLIPATHNVGEALKLQGLAADIARGRNISLAEATTNLVQVEQGRYTGLVRAGILASNQVKAFKDQQDAIDALTQTYGGNATAYAKTFAGELAALSAESHNLAENLGQDLLPPLTATVSAIGTVVGGVNAGIGAIRDLGNAIPGLGSLNQYFGTAASGSSTLKGELKNLAKAQDDYLTAAGASGAASQDATQALFAYQSQAKAVAGDQALLSQATTDSGAAFVSATDAAQQFKAAQQALNNDLSAGTVGQLAQDYVDLENSAYKAAQVEQQVSQIQGEAQATADSLSGAVISVADAYIYLGQTAAQNAVTSTKNLSDAAFVQFDATQKTSSAADQFSQSLDNLTKTQGAAAGGGRTAAAAFYDEQQKLISVRDATQAVSDDQYKLTTAQEDASTALINAAKAAQDYQDALHGVNIESEKGQSAARTLAEAKDTKTTTHFDVVDAQKALNDAVKQFGVHSEQAQRAQVALNDAKRRDHDATQALADAQANLNGTLNGFAQGSPQLVTATDNLRTANDNAHTAVIGLRDANDAAHDSVIGLGRATADLNGQLTSLSTSRASGQVQSFSSRLDAVKTSAKGLADSIREEVTLSTGSIAQGIDAEISTLKSIVDQNPLLKGAFDTVLQNLQIELQKFITPSTGGAFRVQFKAAGGPADARSPYIIGEQGPELFIPNVSGTIIPNSGLRSRTNTGQVVLAPVVNVHGAVTGNDVVVAIRDWVRTSGPREVQAALGL